MAGRAEAVGNLGRSTARALVFRAERGTAKARPREVSIFAAASLQTKLLAVDRQSPTAQLGGEALIPWRACCARYRLVQM
eukprot:COSAG04_NODE_2158_length_4660_cov_28.902214_2_plen_80_part_00